MLMKGLLCVALLFLASGQEANFPLVRFVKTAGTSSAIVKSVSFSPDGSKVVSGDKNGTLNVWAVAGDSSSWQLLRELGSSSGNATYVKFSPDGSMVASGDGGGKLQLWEASSWRLLKTLQNVGAINALAFSPDGSILATGDDTGNLTFWRVAGDVATWGRLQTIGSVQSGVVAILSVDFSPDGLLVVTGSRLSGAKNAVDLWGVEGPPSSWHFLRRLGNSTSRVWSVQFSPDGFKVVSGEGEPGDTGRLALWQVEEDPSAQPLRSAHTAASIWSVAFASNGSMVVSGDFHANLALWQVEGRGRWQPHKSMQNGGSPIYAVDVSSDNTKMVSGNDAGNINVWALGGDPTTWDLLRVFDNNGAIVLSVDYSPDGSVVASGDNSGNVVMWAVGKDPSSWQKITLGNGGSFIHVVKFSPDGSTLASGEWAGPLSLWAVGGSPSSWKLIGTVQTGRVTCQNGVSFSPDGSRLVSGDQSGNISVWAVGGPAVLTRITSLANLQVAVNAVSFTPDGSKVVTGDQNGNLDFWNVSGEPSTWGLITTLQNPGSNINAMSLSSDGSKLASGDDMGRLTLWNITGDPSTWSLLQVVGNSGSNIYSVSFSLDGSRVASGDQHGNLALWDVSGDPSSWQFLRMAGSTGSKVNAVSFSPDGSKLASGDKAGNIGLWAASDHNASRWRASPMFGFLMAVNQYPTTLQEFTRMTSCSEEFHNAGLHQVCNVTVNQSSSTFLRRSSEPGVVELLSHYLPVVRANFAGADLSTLTAQDLLIPWRTRSLWLQDTGFPSSASDLFNFLKQHSPYVVEINVSNTFVAGPVADMPRFLKVFSATNTFITNVSEAFFRGSVELLDLRNTTYLENAEAGALNNFTFRRGVPSCGGDAPEGFQPDGLLCKYCLNETAGPRWWFDGRPAAQQCLPCLSKRAVMELEVAGAVLVIMVAGLGLVAYKFRARLRALRAQADFKRLRQWTRKGKLAFFAYQQMSQLGLLINPLPSNSQSLTSAADISNFHWLSNTAFVSCTLGLGYHEAWVLAMLEVALMLAAAVPIGRVLKASWLESLTFAHSLTIMTVAAKTLPLFDCDERLVKTSLPIMAELKTPRLKVDYGIDCFDTRHQIFSGLGMVVLGGYCILIPLLQTLWLWRVRSTINPPLTRDEYFKAHAEVRRFAENHGFPLESLDQMWLVELGAIRARGVTTPIKEVQMVLDYAPSKWWWFPVPTMSRVLLAGVYVCPAQDQAFLGCALCMIVALGLLFFRPHVRQTDNEHAMLCQGAVALAFALSSVQPATPAWLTVAIWSLFAVPVLSLLYHSLSHLKPSYESRWLLEEFVTYSEPVLVELCAADSFSERAERRTGNFSTWSP